MAQKTIKAGLIGASGYTGVDLLRLGAVHPGLEFRVLTANSHAGKPLGTLFPHLAHLGLPDLIATDEANWDGIDVAFAALPHGTTQKVVAALPEHLTVIDLSADFRLRNVDTYAEWYGHEHYAAELQPGAVYGLTEHYREALRSARIIACPGCYPTAALLLLIPLLKAGLLQTEDLIIDAKSGVTGAGRSLKEQTLFCEVAEAMHPYGIASHRHAPEIEQELSRVAGQDMLVNFTPHLVPMNRGELLTVYAKLADGKTARDLRQALTEAYADEPFVDLVAEGLAPATRHVRGSNRCHLGVFEDRLPGRVILVSVLDNLVKGSSGQALQNFNVRFGFPEATGLEQLALFP
jgi:N-acetyl-gamma-glutamyl-phosphate reductase